MKCHQCANQAMYDVQGVPLCLNCTRLTQEMKNQQLRALMQHANYMAAEAEAAMGFGRLPRYDLAAVPPKPQAKLTFNNIVVKNSVVGAISIGDAQKIDVSLSQIALNGQTELSGLMAKFTQAVIDSRELNKQSKDEMLELIASLSDELAKPQEQRKAGLLKALLQNIQLTAASTTSLVDAWHKLHPHLTLLLQALQNAKK